MDRLIDTDELATALGVSPRTVDTWRTAGEGPDFIRIGAQVRYRESDVEEWLATVRVIQGNTAGRVKPGPGWADFVSKAIQHSDASIDRRNLWRVWNEYLATDPAAQNDSAAPQLESDIRHALKEFAVTVHSSPRITHLEGIRLTAYGQTLLTTAKRREWNLPGFVPAAEVGGGLTGEHFALGRRGGADPTEVVIDFARRPLLAVFGRGTGKTETLRHLIRQITARRSGPQDTLVVVYDPRRGLRSETQHLISGEDKYEADPGRIAPYLKSIEKIINDRTSPQESDAWSDSTDQAWSGPNIYLVIDDLDWALDPGGSIGSLFDKLARRSNVGLRIIVTDDRSFEDRSLRLRRGLKLDAIPDLVNIVTLGDKDYHDGKLIGSFDLDLALPAGAGYLTSSDTANNGYLQIAYQEND